METEETSTPQGRGFAGVKDAAGRILPVPGDHFTLLGQCVTPSSRSSQRELPPPPAGIMVGGKKKSPCQRVGLILRLLAAAKTPAAGAVRGAGPVELTDPAHGFGSWDGSGKCREHRIGMGKYGLCEGWGN